MKLILREAYEYLSKHKYKYKGRKFTKRTIKTMSENGTFKTLSKCECGRCLFVDIKELEGMVK